MVLRTKRKLQKGLSLIEASMVLVLSAVVVAGVMIYYQTAQKNNQLDQFSTQIMHIVSEINGLYAGATKIKDGISYDGLTTNTILIGVNDVEKKTINNTDFIKTPFPQSGLLIQGAKLITTSSTGKPNYQFTNINANRFAVVLHNMDVATCQKIVAMNFGPQLEGIQVSYIANDAVHNFNTKEFVNASDPIQNKFLACQNAAINPATSSTKFGGTDVILIMK